MRVLSPSGLLVFLLVHSAVLVSPFNLGDFFRLDGPLSPSRKTFVRPIEPVKKVEKVPVLEVTDAVSRNRVHLVGVSHGAPASAALVRQTVQRVNPSVIVLELCNDRYLSISLDAKLRPSENTTMQAVYDNKIQKIQKMEMEKSSSLRSVGANFKFMQSQGFLVGTFIAMGMLVTSVQRVFRLPLQAAWSSAPKVTSTDDEFVSAMRIAKKYSIPIRMGDAPQEETLRNVRKVIALETLNPMNIVEGAKSLTFSLLGSKQGAFLTEDLKKLPSLKSTSRYSVTNFDEEVFSAVEASQWINIPKVYTDNTKMLYSLLPLFGIALIVPLLTSVEISNGAIENAQMLQNSFTIPSLLIDNPFHDYAATHLQPDAATRGILDNLVNGIFMAMTNDMPPQVEFTVDTVIDFVSILLLIRLAKIIGYDRDQIIARKISTVCEEFPGEEVVAVLGMLHCNGVARYLLSGKNPLNEKNVLS